MILHVPSSNKVSLNKIMWITVGTYRHKDRADLNVISRYFGDGKDALVTSQFNLRNLL